MINKTKLFRKLSINRKIFWGMLVTSTLMILIILFSTSFIIFTQGMRMATTSSMHELNYISKQLDFSLKTVENFSKTIAVDPLVQKITSKYNNEHDKFTQLDVMYLKDRIDKIIQSTEFIHSVTLYNKDKDLIATTDIATTSPSIEGIDIQSNVWITREKMIPQVFDDTSTVISLLKRYYSYDLGEWLGYIEISIPETSISDIYKSNSQNKYGTLFIVNNYGLVQSTDGFYKLYQRYPDFEEVIDVGSSGYNFVENDIVFFKYFPKLDWYIIHKVDMDFFMQPIYTLIGISALIGLCGITLCIIFSHKISKSITWPIYKLIGHIQGVTKGHWTPMPDTYTDEEIGFLFREFNQMITAQTELKDRLLKEQKLKQQLSLDLLQQQVNPHFLYNALDNICSLAEIDEKDTLINIVMNLSKFYRETLSNGSFFVTIENELAITESYLNILHVRYYNRFDFSITCPDHLRKLKCLKLLLQPIVENSIYHGIKEMDKRGIIHIDVTEDNKGIVFQISDNGIGITDETQDKIWRGEVHSFGIKNIDQRIKLYYGDDYGLNIENNQWGGCTVTIRISKKN